MDHGILLHRDWDTCLPFYGPPTGGARRPDGIVKFGGHADNCHQNVGYGLTTMKNGGLSFGGHIQVEDDRGDTIV